MRGSPGSTTTGPGVSGPRREEEEKIGAGYRGGWWLSCKADLVAIGVFRAGVGTWHQSPAMLSSVKGNHVWRPSQIRGKGVKERLRFVDQVKRGLFKHLSRTGMALQKWLVTGVQRLLVRCSTTDHLQWAREGPGSVGLSRLSFSWCSADPCSSLSHLQ